jgi:hypothetical protein
VAKINKESNPLKRILIVLTPIILILLGFILIEINTILNNGVGDWRINVIGVVLILLGGFGSVASRWSASRTA